MPETVHEANSVHAVLSASGSHRWIECPPSALLEKEYTAKFGEETSSFAEEGTKAHAVGEARLRKANGEWDDKKYKAVIADLEKESGAITPSMSDYVDTYCDIVLEKFYKAQHECEDAKLCIESRLDFSKWVPGGFGTGDAVIVSDQALEVCDLKYGMGVRVDAKDNPQGRLYALGAMALYGDLYDFRTIRMTFIQPRLEHVTEETLTREDLLKWALDVVVPAAQLASVGAGEFKVGDHCRFCKIKAICKARVADSLAAFRNGMTDIATIDDAQIPGILRIADDAIDWLNSLKEYALKKALDGQRWPGYKLVRGRKGNRKYTDENEVLKALINAGYSEEQYCEKKLKSITALEKSIGKDAFAKTIGELTAQPDGKLTLVPEEDKREAVNMSSVDYADLNE